MEAPFDRLSVAEKTISG